MKVLALVTARFRATYGFSLTIDDLDPTFTLGDLARQLERMRASLKSSGDYARQRSLAGPSLLTRVAVIAPAQAAGLGDFEAESTRLESRGLCAFVIHHAAFQGSRVGPDLLAAVEQVSRSGPYDAVVVLRGGGATTDLGELNIEAVARALARLPFPVLTGIGHERNKTLLDEIAQRAFDTPSKVALHIRTHIAHEATRQRARESTVVSLLDRSIADIGEAHRSLLASALSAVQQLIQLARQRTITDTSAVHHAAGETLHRTNTQLQLFEQRAAREASRTHQKALARAATDLAELREAPRGAIADARHSALMQSLECSGHVLRLTADATASSARLAERVNDLVPRFWERLQSQVTIWADLADSFNPKRQLDLGYAIVRTIDGSLLRTAPHARAAAHVQIEFSDGPVRGTIEASNG